MADEGRKFSLASTNARYEGLVDFNDCEGLDDDTTVGADASFFSNNRFNENLLSPMASTGYTWDEADDD